MKISGFAPALPTNGLSAGTPPSSLMRSVLPTWLSSACAFMRRLLSSTPVQHSRSRSPTMTYSELSGPNIMWPARLPLVSHASATKISASSVSLSPSRRPREIGERVSLRSVLRIRHVDEVVLRELRMDGEAVQRVARPGRGGVGDVHTASGAMHAVADDAELAVALGDEHGAVGQ